MITVRDFSDLALFRLALPPCLTVWPYHEVVLTGHRIGLYTILRELHEGRSRAEILEDLDTLEPELLDPVLAFIRTHPVETEGYRSAYKAELDRQHEEFQKRPPSERGPSAEELRRRWVEKFGALPSADLGPEFDRSSPRTLF